MKRLLSVLIILFFCSVASARMTIPQLAGDVESQVTPCTVSQQTETGASDGLDSVGKYSTELKMATQFQYSGTDGKAICAVSVWIQAYGTPSQDYYVAIYSDSSNDPDAALGTSDAKDVSGIGSSEVEVEFTFSTPTSALSTSTLYHVVLYTASNDSSNYINWHYDEGTAGTKRVNQWNGSAWSEISTTRTQKFELFSQ